MSANPIENFRIRLNRWGFEWDSDYGCEHRRGWSATFDGHYIVELAPFFTMLRRCLLARRAYLKDCRESQ